MATVVPLSSPAKLEGEGEWYTLPLVTPTTNMSDVVLVMTKKTFGVAGVADADGHLIGIVTDGDLRRHIGGDLFFSSPCSFFPGLRLNP